MGDVAPAFVREFAAKGPVSRATLTVTAMGVYEAQINGKRVSDYVLAPGWTVYAKRYQYQQYDVTDLLAENNELQILVGRGWYHGNLGWTANRRTGKDMGVIAQLEMEYTDGSRACIVTDEAWQVRESCIRFSDIYDGETCDATITDTALQPVDILDKGTDNLIPQEGEMIREQDRIRARSIFTTPNGEVVVDFGQEVTGYVEFTVDAKAGDPVEISHGEVLDKEGNFYNANYRSAKAKLYYTCRDGKQTYKPKLTFFGFRYIRLDQFPGAPSAGDFTAIAVSSDLRRTGFMRCGHPLVNRLYENVIWGQKGNFLDIPTDCPQRDERLGWTGDAQVFIKTASYNYDVQKFFHKWLADLAADQMDNGGVPNFIPAVMEKGSSAAWAMWRSLRPGSCI